MSTRVIRKYANRRLYDSRESRHMTLDEVRQLIVAGEQIRVEDAKTGDDLTRSILLQIIMEREEAGRPILSQELLEQLIRFYGGAMQDFLGAYLERSVSAFVANQETFQEQLLKMARDNPVAELAKKNLTMWADLHEQLLSAWNPALQKKKGKSGDD